MEGKGKRGVLFLRPHLILLLRKAGDFRLTDKDLMVHRDKMCFLKDMFPKKVKKLLSVKPNNAFAGIPQSRISRPVNKARFTKG